VNIFLVRLP